MAKKPSESAWWMIENYPELFRRKAKKPKPRKPRKFPPSTQSPM